MYTKYCSQSRIQFELMVNVVHRTIIVPENWTVVVAGVRFTGRFQIAMLYKKNVIEISSINKNVHIFIYKGKKMQQNRFTGIPRPVTNDSNRAQNKTHSFSFDRFNLFQRKKTQFCTVRACLFLYTCCIAGKRGREWESVCVQDWLTLTLDRTESHVIWIDAICNKINYIDSNWL